MPAPTNPPSLKTFARESVIFAPTLANPTVSVTVAEATAASNLDLTLFFFGTWGRPTQATNRPRLARRLGRKSTAESIGVTDYSGGDLQYVTNPHGATGTDARKAKEKLLDGTTGFFIVRIGVLPEVDFTASPIQRVNVWPVEFGPQYEMPSGDGEEQEAVVMQSFAVGIPGLSVPIVA